MFPLVQGKGTVLDQWREAGIDAALGRMTAEELYQFGLKLLTDDDNLWVEVQRLENEVRDLEDEVTELRGLETENEELNDQVQELEQEISRLKKGK